MGKLNPSILAKIYTLEEIEAKITTYTEVVEAAAGNKSYTLNTVQESQSVSMQSLSDLTDLLNSWIEAKAIKSGADEGARFYKVDIGR